jgi:Ca2+-transporting ATPase
MVIGSVGAGHTYRAGATALSDPAAHDPSYSTQALVDAGQGQLNPAASARAGHSRTASVSTSLPAVKEL